VQAFRPDGSLLASFYAYDPSFNVGVYVAAADLDGLDANAELITGPDFDGGPHVKTFDVADVVAEVESFYAYDPSFAGGVRVGAGFRAISAPPFAGAHPELLTGAGPGGGPHVKSFDATGDSDGLLDPEPGVAETTSFFAFDPSFAGGVFVSV
jgi:hypothetical protein